MASPGVISDLPANEERRSGVLRLVARQSCILPAIKNILFGVLPPSRAWVWWSRPLDVTLGIQYDATEVMQGVTEVLCYGTAIVADRI
jgi:hypothetical protein